MRRRIWLAVAGLALAACEPPEPNGTAGAEAVGPGDYSALVEEPWGVAEAKAAMAPGEGTAREVARRYLDRIAAVDDAGPMLNAVIAVNPNALEDAVALDEARAEGAPDGPLFGVPILVKDNIETRDPVATTAGSLALAENFASKDAPVIARLRSAGAVILGKTNLSEWANFRSDKSSSGWSAVGGQTANPHALLRNPCGSSAGSGAAAAAGLSAAAIGTETDGSIICPAAQNGIVGIKPTVGLVSRTGIIPISASQDTAGPMTLTVADAALLLGVMAGSDPEDPATAEADARKQDYTSALKADALQGQRIGVARFLAGYHEGTDQAFEAALTELKAAGAELVDIDTFENRGAISDAEWIVLKSEFLAGLNAYLATTPDSVKTRTLDDLIAFNEADATELSIFGQEIFVESAKAPALTDPVYIKARDDARRLAGPEGIDAMLKQYDVAAIVAPSGGPAWLTDHQNGDHFLGSATALPAVAGYPHITVPMGLADGMPVGLSFFAEAWSEPKLIGFAYAYEQRTKARVTPTFVPDVN
ncbi:MAG: amidase [Hyphomonadaceae bacterium]